MILQKKHLKILKILIKYTKQLIRRTKHKKKKVTKKNENIEKLKQYYIVHFLLFFIWKIMFFMCIFFFDKSSK